MSHGVILCVDDEAMVLTALRTQFRKAFAKEYEIETAESAEEGLEILESLAEEGLQIVVIVSDWLMPGMRGDQFLIEAHQRFPKVIKIMLSGQADPAAIQRARDEANLLEFISKPWDGDAVVRSIRDALLHYESA